MPKASTYTLLWLPEQEQYELRERDHVLPVSPEGEPWHAWLAAHSSFAFQGQQGKLTLLKEGRARGAEGYWYAYRSRDGRTGKKYLGRSRDLSMDRLEKIAGSLVASPFAMEPGRAEKPGPANSSPALLLTPKLRVPPLRASLVARERLLTRLDRCLEGRLTLISAPAGFGKTTLVCQWVAELGTREDVPGVAWISLDAGDNDPARFWRYVITACQPFLPDHGRTALAHLQARPQSPPFEPLSLTTTLTIFVNELSRSSQRGLLVLEDYQVISEPGLHETLAFLIDQLPATLRLLIISRSDPALPLVRLRAKGELHELRAADLRFSHQETEEFLRQAVSLPIPAGTMDRLVQRLEGWAAGLRLVALALQRQSTPQEIERFLASLAGSHRSLLEYFVGEVLEAQPPAIQRFLLSTSALNRLTATLCDAVTGQDRSEEVLKTLERANLFLETLDERGEWYRYHALFAESMQHEARQRLGEEQLRQLAGRASRWYEEQGLLAEAVETALQAQEMERAASLVEQIYEATTQQENISELHTLYRWMQQLPDAILARRPLLCLKYAIIVLFVAISGPAPPEVVALLDKLLQMVEVHAQKQQKLSWQGQALALRSMLAWRQSEAALARDYADQALALLPSDEIQLRSTALSVLARIDALAGHFDTAREKFLQARTLCEIVGNRVLIRAMTGMLSGVCIEQGELHQAAAYLRQMLSDAREAADFEDICHAQLGMAHLLYQWNELDRAWSAAQEALEVGERLAHDEHISRAILMLAQIEHARGQRAEARQRLDALLACASSQRLAMVYREVQTCLARFQLANGDLVLVLRQADATPVRDAMMLFIQSEHEELLAMRLQVAQGEAEKALETLQHLLDQAHAARHTRGILEISVHIALAQHACGRTAEAIQTLQATLALARSEGYLRIFLDEGTTMVTLLRATLVHTRERTLLAYIRQLLQAFARETTYQPAPVPPDALLLNEPLSPQERRVLHLLASGRSNAEIAREHIVSVNTVRTQVQSIYRKLNVNNRVAASEIARDLHLL